MVKRYKCPKWVYEMRDRTQDGVIRESEPFCESGMMPSSIVLRKLDKGEFVSHVKVYNQDENGKPLFDKPSYAWGHYFRDFDKAVEDYKKRCEDYEVDG